MNVRSSLDGRDHWHAYVRQVFQNLNTFVMNLAPNAGIGDVTERRKIDARNEVPACAGQNYDFVRSILRDPVKRVDKFCMVLCRKGERSAVGVKFCDQYPIASRVSFRLR